MRMIYKIRYAAVILLILVSASFAICQTVKTDVLVVGATPAGLAAAIQSAHSGVKTLLIDNGNFEELRLSAEEAKVRSGIYAQFIRRVEIAQKFAYNDNQKLSPAFVASIFKAWADTVKNLTISAKTNVNNIRKDGKIWSAELSGKRTVKADVVVDASENEYVSAMAAVKRASGLPDSIPYHTKKYRTGIALIPSGQVFPATLPLVNLTGDPENFLFSSASGAVAGTATGQAAGAAAAYCAFFKTTSKKLNVRVIQSELLSFGAHLLAFDDIARKDSNAAAIQSIALTGILKGKMVGGKLLFLPDSSVSTAEIVSPVKEYFTRSQIWFLDNSAERLTLKGVLNLIKFVASRGEELNREVEKGWTSSLKLPGKFDAQRVATRREFAVLFNAYVKPFSVAVDLDGNLKR
ncbi:FAD-dependent oxidoreductase [Arcticibacter sp. MXS-1]|uniref:FAD-dependent oxidoreductase n=1 Tax=Arcticibacter sp. MXS-1 TaxID=3341726 RepID=UPI0035A8CF67